MNRRTFLRSAALTTGSLALTPALWQPTATEAAPSDIDIKPVLKWLGTFVAGIAADVISSTVKDWLSSGDQAANTANDAVVSGKKRGYTTYNDYSVNVTNTTYFFPALTPQRNDIYVPFIYPTDYGYQWTYLAGPALYGLAQGAQDLTRWYDSNQIAGMLVPTGGCTSPNQRLFGTTFDWLISFPTIFGTTSMSYRIGKKATRRTRGQARLQVSSWQNDGTLLADGGYDWVV